MRGHSGQAANQLDRDATIRKGVQQQFIREREDVMTMQWTIQKSLSAAVIVATCFSFSTLAQGLPKVSQPEEVGFSSERLNRVAKVFQADVDKGLIPGAVVLIARNASDWGSWSAHDGDGIRRWESPANSIGRGPGERRFLLIRRRSW